MWNSECGTGEGIHGCTIRPMRRLLIRLSPALRLTRVTTAFAAVANVWFIILWTRASGPVREPGFATLHELPLWALLAGGAVNALGLFAFGAALNDVLDHRRDAALNPDRPIPSGQITVGEATTLVATTLGTAVLGATLLGIPAVLLTLTVAGAILVFNGVGKYIPGIGLVLLGLVYAGHMVVPNLNLRFVWPVWLVMTHTLAIEGLRHALRRTTPGISGRALALSLVGWVFWSAIMFGVMWWRNRDGGGLWPYWVRPHAAIGPTILALLFSLWAWRKTTTHGRGQRAAEKIARYGALWLSLYACMWLVGQGYRDESIILGSLTLVGFLGMTIMRELYAMLEQPFGYRR